MDENTANQLQFINFRDKDLELEKRDESLSKRLDFFENKLNALEISVKEQSEVSTKFGVLLSKLNEKLNILESKPVPKLSLLNLFKRK